MRLTRREILAGAAASLAPGPVVLADEGFAHGYAVLGDLKYHQGFKAFGYVQHDAPKGGTLRLSRLGRFGTTNTLRYPGLPPADLRLIYDRLLVRSADEIASFYGVLADRFAVAPDYSAVEFELELDAAWQDGRPLTSRDVVFTLNTLRSEGAPFYRQVFRPLSAEVLGPKRFVIRNSRHGDRDLLRKLSSMPIHPEHQWQDGTPDQLVGSGPLRVGAIDAPRSLILTRDPQYWGASKAVNRGRWNFDEITFQYFRDATVTFEAFKRGDADLHIEGNPVRWSTGYQFPAATSGRVRQVTVDPPGVGELMGVVFNLRHPLLSILDVRRGLALAYDFETTNDTLFAGGHRRFGSVFAGTPLEAKGEADARERAVLAAAAPGPALLAEADPLAEERRLSSRDRLRAVAEHLDRAGLVVERGARMDPSTGEPIRLQTLVTSLDAERPVLALQRTLEQLGIALDIVTGDRASLSNRLLDRDYDLATLSWSPAELPGTAERLLWHSALADQPGSYAVAGLKSALVDIAIEALEQAQTPEALVAAGRAFDRAWRHEIPMIPLWRDSVVRFAASNHVAMPSTGHSLAPSPVDRWWSIDAV